MQNTKTRNGVLLLLALQLMHVQGEFHCQTGEWWNGTCVACTKCDEVVLRTCQPHQDTFCGSFSDIQINVIQPSKDEQALEELLATAEEEAWEWSEISLAIAAVTSLVFVFAALYLIRAHKKQWNKMQQMDKEMEQDISRLIGKLAEVPNIQKTTAVLVDEQQIKKQSATNGSPFRWIYLDQLLGKSERKSSKNVYTERNNNR